MTLKKFEELIQDLKNIEQNITVLYKLKVDLIEFAEPYQKVITNLLKEIYGEEGYDWISWFCYDCDFGEKQLGAWDENKNPICYDIKSLWEYIEKNHKTK